MRERQPMFRSRVMDIIEVTVNTPSAAFAAHGGSSATSTIDEERKDYP